MNCLTQNKMERTTPRATGRRGGAYKETLKIYCKKEPKQCIKESVDEDPYLNMSEEKLVQLATVLAEINRKIVFSSWKA